MHTDIYYKNLSLNPHCPDVSFFQRNLYDGGQNGIALKVIQKCGYDWMHYFRIYWDVQFGFFSSEPHVSQTRSLKEIWGKEYNILQHKERARIKIKRQLLSHEGEIVFLNDNIGNLKGVNLYRNHKLIASQQFNGSDHSAKFKLSTVFSVGADLRVQEGAPVKPANLNPSVIDFDLKGIRSAMLVMQGGQPGPKSKALGFHLIKQTYW